MNDENRVKEKPKNELTKLRQRITELEASQTRLRQAQDELRIKDIAIASSTTAIAFADLKGSLTYVNQSFLKMWGYDEKEILGKPIVNFWQTKERFIEAEVALCDKGNWAGELVARRKDGSIFDVHLSATMATDQTGKPVSIILSIIDITEQKRAPEALRKIEERYRLLAENVTDVIWTMDMELKFTYISPSVTPLFGYSAEEAMTLSLPDLLTQDSLPVAMKAVADLMGPAEMEQLEEKFELEKKRPKNLSISRTLELKQKSKDGSTVWTEVRLSLLRDPNGRPMGILGVTRDITERKETEETRKYLAYHDALTGLPNRLLFCDRLTVALAHAQRNQQNLCVLSFNLDRFKEVNDRLGYAVADQLLQQVAVRLTSLLRKSDTVARRGGDEFMVLLPAIVRVEDAATVAQKILDSFRKPFTFEGHKIDITASIGIAVYPEDGQDADTLMKNADAAMYRAKEKGRDNCQRYNQAMDSETSQRQ